MAITLMDIARESVQPLKHALASTFRDPVESRFTDLVRSIDARGDEGIGTPIAELGAAIGRRFDFQI